MNMERIRLSRDDFDHDLAKDALAQFKPEISTLSELFAGYTEDSDERPKEPFTVSQAKPLQVVLGFGPRSVTSSGVMRIIVDEDVYNIRGNLQCHMRCARSMYLRHPWDDKYSSEKFKRVKMYIQNMLKFRRKANPRPKDLIKTPAEFQHLPECKMRNRVMGESVSGDAALREEERPAKASKLSSEDCRTKEPIPETSGNTKKSYNDLKSVLKSINEKLLGEDGYEDEEETPQVSKSASAASVNSVALSDSENITKSASNSSSSGRLNDSQKQVVLDILLGEFGQVAMSHATGSDSPLNYFQGNLDHRKRRVSETSSERSREDSLERGKAKRESEVIAARSMSHHDTSFKYLQNNPDHRKRRVSETSSERSREGSFERGKANSESVVRSLSHHDTIFKSSKDPPRSISYHDSSNRSTSYHNLSYTSKDSDETFKDPDRSVFFQKPKSDHSPKTSDPKIKISSDLKRKSTDYTSQETPDGSRSVKYKDVTKSNRARTFHTSPIRYKDASDEYLSSESEDGDSRKVTLKTSKPRSGSKLDTSLRSATKAEKPPQTSGHSSVKGGSKASDSSGRKKIMFSMSAKNKKPSLAPRVAMSEPSESSE